MDLSDWVSIVGAITAVVALFAAFAANKRAREANKLQARIDSRGREFRDVSWEIEFESKGDAVRVLVTNTGLTPAIATTLVIEDGRARTLVDVGDVRAGATAVIELAQPDAIRAAVIANGMRGAHTAWLIHWSSPLGKVSQLRHAGLQLY